MAAVVRGADGVEKISAIVYLADGQECRCLQLFPDATVRDMIEQMLQVQDDWDELGKEDKPKQIKMKSNQVSSTDDEIDLYGIVMVHTPADGVPTEKVLPRNTPIMAPELKMLRVQWQRVYMQHIAARFTSCFQKGGKRKDSKKKQKKRAKAGGEYWFVSAVPKSSGSRDDIRIKFVNLDDYNVVKGREGWLDVKEKNKLKSRWVVYKENTILCFKDADDDQPTTVLEDVDKCEMKIKRGSKDTYLIKLKRNGSKLGLICENNVMADKWFDAIRQGSSGSTKPAQSSSSGGMKLKLGCAVELIPEYTEEEEMEDILQGNLVNLQKMALSHIASQVTAAGMKELASDADDINNALVNRHGEYLTVDTMETLCHDAGYMTTEGTQMVNSDGDYLTVDVMSRIAGDAGYLATNEMENLLSRIDGGYMTTEQLKAATTSQDGGYMTTEQLAASQDGGYLTTEQMRVIASVQDGGYLSVQDMQALQGDGGYLTQAEMKFLVAK